MTAHKWKAFVSYADRVSDWVQILHSNLERHFGERTIFLSKLNIHDGNDWINAIEQALVSSEWLILVVTPDAIASPRVEEEVHAVINRERYWRAAGRIRPIILHPSPLPPFLSTVQRIEFRSGSESEYKRAFRQLVASFDGSAPGDDSHIIIPPVVPPLVPADKFSRTIQVLDQLLTVPWVREQVRTIAGEGLLRHIDGQADSELRGNALLCNLHRGSPLAGVLSLLDASLPHVPDHRLRTSVHTLLQDLQSGLQPGPIVVLSRYLERVLRKREAVVTTGDPFAPRAYISLRLSRRTESSTKSSEATGLEGLMSLRQSPDAVRKAVWIWGGPGAGKSTLLAQAEHFAAGQALRSSYPVPIYVALSEASRSSESLFSLACGSGTMGDKEGLERELERHAAAGNAVFLLDALDEVPASARASCMAMLSQCRATYEKCLFVITSRPLDSLAVPTDFEEYDILPIDHDEKINYLAQYVRDEDASGRVEKASLIVKSLERDGSLHGLVDTPLLLACVALMTTTGLNVPQEQERVLPFMLDTLLAQEYKAAPPLALPLQVRELLGRSALSLCLEGAVTCERSQLEALFTAPENADLWKPMSEAAEWNGDPARLLIHVFERTGIVGPYAPDGRAWRFLHRAFQDTLAAEQLARLLITTPARVLAPALAAKSRDLEFLGAPLVYAAEAGVNIEEVVGVARILSPHLLAMLVSTIRRPSLQHVAEACASPELQRYRGLFLSVVAPRTVAPVEDIVKMIETEACKAQARSDLYCAGIGLSKLRTPTQMAEVFTDLCSQHRSALPTTSPELFAEVETPDGPKRFWGHLSTNALVYLERTLRHGNSPPREHPPAISVTTTPVTVRQFRLVFPKYDPPQIGGAEWSDQQPATGMSWFQAWAYCQILGCHMLPIGMGGALCRFSHLDPLPLFGSPRFDVGWQPEFYRASVSSFMSPKDIAALDSELSAFKMYQRIWEWSGFFLGRLPETFDEARVSDVSGSRPQADIYGPEPSGEDTAPTAGSPQIGFRLMALRERGLALESGLVT